MRRLPADADSPASQVPRFEQLLALSRQLPQAQGASQVPRFEQLLAKNGPVAQSYIASQVPRFEQLLAACRANCRP